MQQWRKTHPLTGEARKKMNARSYLNSYLKRGKVRRETCKKCGTKAEAHHPDYSKPLFVIWLCRFHHLKLHQQKTHP